MTSISLSIFEEEQSFRSDELYFIRLAAVYIQEIFWEVFARNQKKSRKRGKKMKQGVRNNNDLRPHTKDNILQNQNFDPLDEKFLRFLQKDLRQYTGVFEDRLKFHHAIFLSFDQFIEAAHTLRKARGYLEHYKEKKKAAKKHDDGHLCKVLGTFLLAGHHNLFLGRMRSTQKKFKTKENKELGAKVIQALTDFLKKKREERKQANKTLFSEERKRSKLKDKQHRKSLVNENVLWRKFHKKCKKASSSEYSEFEFKKRYAFITSRNIEKIRNFLAIPEEEITIKWDIEPFYVLTGKVNLVIHRFLENLPKNKEGKLTDTSLKEIRNNIAHNKMFWDIKSVTVPDIFSRLAQAIKAHQGKEKMNDFISALETIFRKESYAVFHDDGQSQTKYIRRWTKEMRVEKEKETLRINKRRRVKRKVARWMRDLRGIREDQRNPIVESRKK